MNQTLLEVAHEAANDLYEAGVINAVTMREYDALCVPPVRDLREGTEAVYRIKGS